MSLVNLNVVFEVLEVVASVGRRSPPVDGTMRAIEELSRPNSFVGRGLIPCQDQGLDLLTQAGTPCALQPFRVSGRLFDESAERLTDTAVGQTCREIGAVGVS